MSVRVIAYTNPAIPDMKPEALVAYVARVSNPGNQMNLETAPRLLAYLRRNNHWSPFEMASATLEIETTRDIARQILRHRSFSFQEFSQRYAEATSFHEPREARLQDTTNRQNSLPSDDHQLEKWWRAEQRELLAKVTRLYSKALEKGIAKEQARAVLPEGLTHSRLYMAGTLRSWLHYIELRTDAGTQKEHRIIAEKCRVALQAIYPGVFSE
jgi:thymidylate synthase (FAD)